MNPSVFLHKPKKFDILRQKLYNTKKCKVINLMKKLLAIILLIITVFTVVACNNEHNAETPTPALNFIDDPEQISEAAKSVVKLNCYDKSGILICTGSGFSVFEEGVIVTNYHVIEDFPARIEIETETGQKCDITGGIGASAERDIAILLYQHRNTNIEIPLLQVGDSVQLKKGEKVIAIGSPKGFTNTVSSGIFSGQANIEYNPYIQFTASISHGSSGGALFNNDGKVIGITTLSHMDGQNLNFAIPIEFAKSLWGNEKSHRYSLNLFYDSLNEKSQPFEEYTEELMEKSTFLDEYIAFVIDEIGDYYYTYDQMISVTQDMDEYEFLAYNIEQAISLGYLKSDIKASKSISGFSLYEKSEFLDEYIVFVIDGFGDYYYTYDEMITATKNMDEYVYWAYNKTQAISLGYKHYKNK